LGKQPKRVFNCGVVCSIRHLLFGSSGGLGSHVGYIGTAANKSNDFLPLLRTRQRTEVLMAHKRFQRRDLTRGRGLLCDLVEIQAAVRLKV
jgi:hypothetical protein